MRPLGWTCVDEVAARAKENISRARRSAVILVFTAGAAALLGAAAAWFAACAGGRVRALCQRAIPRTAAFDLVTLTKGEYALLLAFLQAPAGSVRRRGRRNKWPRAHKFPGNCVKRKPRRNGAEVPTGPVPNPRVEIGHQTVSVFPGYEESRVLS